jgi:hypothetical protein
MDRPWRSDHLASTSSYSDSTLFLLRGKKHTGREGPEGLWDVEAPTFSLDNRLTDGNKVVSLMHRRPLHPNKIPGTHFCYRRVETRVIVWLEGLDKLKKKSTSSGFEPATFRLVAQCLNKIRYRVALFFTELHVTEVENRDNLTNRILRAATDITS